MVPATYVEYRSALRDCLDDEETPHCELIYEYVSSISHGIDHCLINPEHDNKKDLRKALDAAQKDLRTMMLAIMDHWGDTAKADQMETLMWDDSQNMQLPKAKKSEKKHA